MKASLHYLKLIPCILLILPVILTLNLRAQESEYKDAPYFTGMPNYVIDYAQDLEFDEYHFFNGTDCPIVAGKKFLRNYVLKEGATQASELQIVRNYANAVKSIGGTVFVAGVFQCDDAECADNNGSQMMVGKLAKDGNEVWIEVFPKNGGDNYRLTLMIKGVMKQDVNAIGISEALKRDSLKTLPVGDIDLTKSKYPREYTPIVKTQTETIKTDKIPGICIEETPKFPPVIEQVETAIPAFIGYTSKAELNGDPTALLFKPTKISSILEYENLFGGPFEERITITINDSLDSNHMLIGRDIVASPESTVQFFLYYSLKMFFDNGGGKCYIVSVGNYNDPIEPGDDTSGLKGGIKALEVTDEPTLVLFPDAVSLENVDQYGSLVKYSLQLCATLKDRFTIADVKVSDNNQYIEDDINNYRDALGSENLKYGACYYPFIKTIFNYTYSEENVTLIHMENNEDAIINPISCTFNQLETFNPNLFSDIQSKIRQLYVTAPPSGSIAGIYTKIDLTRGVWKAPSNIELVSSSGPSFNLNEQELVDIQNDLESGKSMNPIRFLTGRGIVVFGARTLAGNDNEYRYISVLRSTICIEESIKKGLAWAVFEPNDDDTWLKVRAMTENYLNVLWRNGALQGAKPENAYFVKVGLGETMTAIDINEGRLILEVGMAFIRPAEFNITRLAFKMQGI